MNSGIYTFDQLILDVKDETGYTNLTNRYSEIKRLVLRAEREINPFGSVLVRKKMKLYVGNGNFDGTRFKKEPDFMFLDKVGCCQEKLCEGSYYETVNHVILCDGEARTEITYVYWAIQMDADGNPFTTYNHSEAVVKFIVWKLLSQKAFLKEESWRVVKMKEEEFEYSAAYSRGNDFFPSEESLQRMLLDNQTEKMMLFTEWVRGEDGCMECSCLITEEEKDPNSTTPNKIWSYQFDDTKDPNDEINIITEEWLGINGTQETEESLLVGKEIEQILIGRIGFAVKTDTPNLYQIFDTLNINITQTVFTRSYDSVLGLDIYISKSIYSTGSLYFKFEK